VKRFEWHQIARNELERATARYEGERPGLGREFRIEVESALTRIAGNPEAYAVERRDCRACPLHRFAYVIYYSVEPDYIWIGAIAHASRRPGYWARRRPD
jgi:plasmid stabilization system protein ParE